MKIERNIWLYWSPKLQRKDNPNQTYAERCDKFASILTTKPLCFFLKNLFVFSMDWHCQQKINSLFCSNLWRGSCRSIKEILFSFNHNVSLPYPTISCTVDLSKMVVRSIEKYDDSHRFFISVDSPRQRSYSKCEVPFLISKSVQ